MVPRMAQSDDYAGRGSLIVRAGRPRSFDSRGSQRPKAIDDRWPARPSGSFPLFEGVEDENLATLQRRLRTTKFLAFRNAYVKSTTEVSPQRKRDAASRMRSCIPPNLWPWLFLASADGDSSSTMVGNNCWPSSGDQSIASVLVPFGPHRRGQRRLA